ncbi:MAG: FecR domain-containing protein [Pseudomonadota bacterium]
MSDNPRKELMKEAAAIFLQLRDNPDDPELQAMRDAFIARGPDEAVVYDHLLKTWKASGVAHAPKTLKSVILFLCGLLGTGALAYDPVRIAIVADFSTSVVPEQSTLISGDVAYLDADSALIDETEGYSRDVKLLEGAAFFSVESNARPFTVEVGELSVSVVGTEFETAFVNDSIFVSVAEGQVSVRHESQTWELTAGNKFSWSEELGAILEVRDSVTMASWRTDRLTLDGLTMGQATAIIERRLNGPVVFTNAALRDTVVAGNVDLSQPLLALRILAETVGGRVYHAPGIGRLITRQ